MIDEWTDYFGGINFVGHFASQVTALLRLVYWRGLYDGFIAGTLVVLILKREQARS